VGYLTQQQAGRLQPHRNGVGGGLASLGRGGVGTCIHWLLMVLPRRWLLRRRGRRRLLLLRLRRRLWRRWLVLWQGLWRSRQRQLLQEAVQQLCGQRRQLAGATAVCKPVQLQLRVHRPASLASLARRLRLPGASFGALVRNLLLGDEAMQ
jgi:hypothetical protein